MTPTQLLGVGLIEAHFVGGPADGTTARLHLESTGFPPVHVTILDDDGAIRHLYSGPIRESESPILFTYLGPLPV